MTKHHEYTAIEDRYRKRDDKKKKKMKVSGKSVLKLKNVIVKKSKKD